MRVSGSGGTVRYSYRTAGRLGKWAMASSGPGRFSLAAEVVDVDGELHDRRPLCLQLEVGRTVWAWQDVAPSAFSVEDGLVCEVSSTPEIRQAEE